MNKYFFRSFSGYAAASVTAPDVLTAFRLYHALHPFREYLVIESNLISDSQVKEEIVYSEVTPDGDQSGEAARA